jgi:HAD superfamily hydrolase (TIGR01509 family)
VGAARPGPRRINDLAAVVFDLDGTLVDTRRAVAAARAASLGEFPPLDHLLGRVPRGADDAAYHDRLRELAHGLAPYPGARELLELLPLPAAVVTGASRVAAEIVLGAVGLRGCFDVVVTTDDVRRPKPHPDGLRLACARLGIESAQAAYVGDLAGDAAAARACGALSVGAGWAAHAVVAGADLVLRRPEDLLALLAR